MADTTCLRRSSRETSSKNIIPSSSTRKSERVEKVTVPTPVVKRRSESVDEKKMPSPLRRSGRSRSHSSSSLSDSKSPGSLNSKQKPKKEKSVRQLTFEAKAVNENEEHDLGFTQVKVKRMDARMYRSLFKLPKKDCLAEQTKIVKSNQEGDNNGRDKIDEFSEGSHSDCKEVSKNVVLPSEDSRAKEMRVDPGLSMPVKDLVENNVTLATLVPSNAATNEPGCCREDAVQMLASRNSILDECLFRKSVGYDSGAKSVPSKRKRITVDMDSDVSATLAKGYDYNLIPDGSPSRLGSNIVGTSRPSNAATYETGFVSERVQPDCCRGETLQQLASRNSILDGSLIKSNVGHDEGETLVPSKKKGITLDMNSDVSASSAKADNSNLIHAGGPSCLGGNIMGTDGSSPKRIRLDYNPTISESCNPCETEDGNDIDANMLQKDSPASFLTDAAKNICLICKSEGQLLFCGGKECYRCYHFSCLEPPLLDAPLGVWHCHFCVRKKIEFGVYSVSEGVESIYDVKEVSFSNVNAQKDFLVKYKGLAHVHNRWVPEKQLFLEAPLILKKFNQKNQTLRLKPEWSLPHRLLQKRALICGKQHDDPRTNHAVDKFDLCYEWLVKWRGLGYEHATWELCNASFLYSPEGQSLIRGYEERFQRAMRISSCSKLDKKMDRENSVKKLSQMPDGVSSGLSNNNLDAVNKLREHWFRGQNAIIIDDHDRILKVVAFILSLHSDTHQPFLIVSTAASLHSWEDEFYRLDPSIDVIIYNGKKDIRNGIRRLEFYSEGHCILFQVLIVAPEILIEDMDDLGGIDWETIIVDECQSPKISSCFKQIKMLSTHLRVLLFHGQLKDNIVENINVLDLLDCQIDNEKDGPISNSNNSVQLKERLSSHIAYRCKSDSFKFVEYWVPVQISHVQLEQYCNILLSNDSILRASSKNDSIGALREVLSSIRKCCSHPYIVDEDLPSLLKKGHAPIEHVEVDIKASGKFQLLDAMLMELRKNMLRVLILFQSIGGSPKLSMGNFLEDLLQSRFGSDSYERIDKGLPSSMKQAAMKNFNDKNNGQFAFLLETCACHPSIKLSSVDTIIIFDSDWNPMNDIRSLQKITLDSQFELIKIFRFNSSFTVEEKALVLAKQDKILDLNLQNINWSACHMLLMWGASCLFDELRAFHDCETSISSVKPLFGRSLFKEAMHEFSSLLSQDDGINTSNCSTLLKVQQNGGTYRANFSLLGEVKHRVLDEESPQFFWAKLLEGKHFRWKYLNCSSQRSRKKVHHFDGSVDRPNLVSEGIAKKRKKVSNSVVDQPSKSEGEKLSAGIKAGTSGDLVDRSKGNKVEPEQKCRPNDEQRSLYLLLKPEMTKLCDVLLLPDNVKSMVDNFLEYVMNNHHVNREPVSILQAFQISLIWTAASLLKHKLGHRVSLILAKQHLNFDCKKEEVDYIYSVLRCLKKIFLYRTGNYNDTGSPEASKSSNRPYSCTRAEQEVEVFKKDVSKSIKEIQKKCEKQLKKLHLMQEEERQSLRAAIEDEKTDFERKFKIKLAVIRSCSPNDVTKMENLKNLNIEYERRNVELKCLHETCLKDLDKKQLAEIQKFQDREANWVKDVKSWAQNELLNINVSKELGTGIESVQACDQVLPQNCSKNPFAKGKGHDDMLKVVTETGARVPDTNSPAVVLCNTTNELQNPLVKDVGTNEMGIMVSEDQADSRDEGHNISEKQYVSQGYIITEHSCSREQDSSGNGCEKFSCGSQYGCRDDTITSVLPSPNREMYNVETSDVAAGEVGNEVLKGSSSIDGQDKVHSSMQRKPDETMLSLPKNVASLNLQTPKKHITGVNAMCMPHYENSSEISVAGKCNDSNNSVTENSLLSGERIAKTMVSLLDREETLGLHGTANITDYPENGTALNPSSSMEKISDGGAVNEALDRESSKPCEAASPSNSPDNITLLNPLHQNSSGIPSSIPDEHIPVEVPKNSNEGETISALERAVPVETPGMVIYTDCPENATALNPPSSLKQISDRGSLDVPGFDNVVSPRPCQASSSSDDQVTVSLSNPLLEQHTHDGVPLSISDSDIPVIVPENSHAVADCHNAIESIRNAVEVDKSTTADQQERVPKTTIELSQESPVSRSVNVMDPPEQVQQLLSLEPSPDHNTSGAKQNSSGQADLVSSPVEVNQSKNVSPGMKPLEQVQHLQSAELPSQSDSINFPLETEIEHQPTVVPNQDFTQHDSNSELHSHSHEVVGQPASDSDTDSFTPEVGTQSLDPRNLSTPLEINYHTMQTGAHSTSRMLLHLCYDPLKNELDRIQKVTEQTMKNYEDMKLQLKSDFEKELEELRQKYDIKFQEIEVEFQQTRMTLDTSINIVHKNKLLADAFRSKCLVLKASGTSGMQQDSSFTQQLFHLSRQQSASCPPLVVGSSSCGPSATSPQSPSTTASSQHMVPPIQAGYRASGVFSNVSARLPNINSISLPTSNLQAHGEIRAPAPHLQPYRPSTSAPASSVPALPHGMPSQTATTSVHATSSSFSHRPPRPKPTSDPHLGRQPDSAGGLPNPNLPVVMDLHANASSHYAMYLPNDVSCASDGSPVNQSRFGTSGYVQANSSHQAPSLDLVYLSDDD